MSFEGADSLFGYVAVMNIRRDKLECGLSVFCGDVVEFSTGLIVKNLLFDNVLSSF